MIEIYLLEQLCAFAEYGTLSKAAESLHISQPALSRSMKKIEEELGVSLFERDKAKISLNETGELAAKLATELLSLNLGMVRRIKAFDRSQRSITVGACAPKTSATVWSSSSSPPRAMATGMSISPWATIWSR